MGLFQEKHFEVTLPIGDDMVSFAGALFFPGVWVATVSKGSGPGLVPGRHWGFFHFLFAQPT